MVEEYSLYIYVCPIRSKGDPADSLMRFVICFQKHSGHVFRTVHADGDTI